MARYLGLCAASSVALFFGGSSAFALTGDEVWADLQAFGARWGLEVSAARQMRDGAGRLRLEDVSFTYTLEEGGFFEDEEAITLAVSQLLLSEEADGAVLVTPGQIAITFPEMEEEGPLDMAVGKLALSHENLALRVYEAGEEMAVDLSADRLTTEIEMSYVYELEGARERLSRSLMRTLQSHVEGRIAWGDEGGRSSFHVPLQEDYSLTEERGPGGEAVSRWEAQGRTQDITVETIWSLPKGADLHEINGFSELSKAIREGLAVESTYVMGVSSGSMHALDPVLGAYDVAFEAAPSAMDAKFDAQSLAFGAAAQGARFQLTSEGGAPLSGALGEMIMELEVPVVAPEGGPYRLELGISDVSFDEAAWQIIDPKHALKHEPFHYALDMKGALAIDLLALIEDALEHEGRGPSLAQPKLLSLEFADFSLGGFGALFEARGDFTAPASGGSFPPLVGRLDLRLQGLNQLLSGAIAAGWISQEEAMPSLMMLPMFAVPTGEADSFASKVEIKEDGTLTLNDIPFPLQ